MRNNNIGRALFVVSAIAALAFTACSSKSNQVNAEENRPERPAFGKDFDGERPMPPEGFDPEKFKDFDGKFDGERPDFKKERENEIIGKITSISDDSITISVAERKEMKKPEDMEEGKKPEDFNPEDFKKEDFNMDEMFTLTGDKKTIDISNAKTREDMPLKEGDYVVVELTDKDSNAATSVRGAGMGMRGKGHFGEKPEKKD